MSGQNQGASIEAEREVIERAIRFIEGGSHTHIARDTMADELRKLLAARRTLAAQVGAGELPPLPRRTGTMYPGNYWTASEQATPPGTAITAVYSEDQMLNYARAAIEADRAQQAGVGREYQRKVDEKIIARRDAEIEDLRAQLAAARHVGKHMFDAIAAPASAQPAVKLTRDDSGMCEVSLEIDGTWVPVIRDNGDFISHIVEPVGVRIAQQRARMAERFAERPRTAATADFDLPAPNDEIGAQPDQRESAAVPDGWKLVPVEPTEAMVHAGEDVPPPRPFGKVYRAMLAAAPAHTEACRACNGSGWVVRDPDIGTDQECFVCNGTGQDSANNGADEQKGGENG